MTGVVWFFVGTVAGMAAIALIAPVESSCCKRVAYGARDKIAGYTGSFAGATSALLDATGTTNALPGLLDLFGVPADA